MINICSPTLILAQILTVHAITAACAATPYRKFGLVAFDTGTPIHFTSPIIRYSTGLVVLPGTLGASPSDYFSGMFLGKATDISTSTGIVQVYENSAYRLAVGSDGLLRVVQVAGGGEGTLDGDAVSGGDPAAGGAGTFAVADRGNYFLAEGESQFTAVKDAASGDYLLYVGSHSTTGDESYYDISLIVRYADVEQAVTTLTLSQVVATSSSVGFWNSTKPSVSSSSSSSSSSSFFSHTATASTDSAAETASGLSSRNNNSLTTAATITQQISSEAVETLSTTITSSADSNGGNGATSTGAETTQQGFAAGRGSCAALAVAVGFGALLL
ncbi:uncharacterized protein SAPINGB_P000140 [Magnusiomyces paraingens]|uniref:Uncharacterized protein n=1 Tax=Magnusiomyces paraingens TaxID=2606893 RepID=A0A5E8AXT8_9ASCO|nr:uncharacterized protein SAPINGB_P000140 [Saprochaete ingens]VVT43776.1 unnamed protein product [Saprochaete ingens]